MVPVHINIKQNMAGLHNTTSCSDNVTNTAVGVVQDGCLVWADGSRWDMSVDFGNCVAMAASSSHYWGSESCATPHHYICEVLAGDCSFVTGAGECYGSSTNLSTTTVDSCKSTCDKHDLCWGFKFNNLGLCLMYNGDDPFACSLIPLKTSTVYVKNCFSLMFKSHTGIVASDTSLNEDCDPMTNNGDQMTTTSIYSEQLPVISTTIPSEHLENSLQSDEATSTAAISLATPGTRMYESVTATGVTAEPADRLDDGPSGVLTRDHLPLQTSMTTKWSIVLSDPDTTTTSLQSKDQLASDSAGAANLVLDSPLNTVGSDAMDHSLHSFLSVTSLAQSLSASLPEMGSKQTGEAETVVISHPSRKQSSSSSPLKPTASTKSSLIKVPRMIRMCPCDCRVSRHNATASKDDYMDRLADLAIETSNLSSTRRKLHSAPDSRASAKAIGYFGVALVTVIFGLLVIPDVVNVLFYLKHLEHKTARSEQVAR
ncbi:uncharacterized protein LOC112577093 isoform X2 [Pomacea canaliculata]|uniref:uncharacterized protein LOC112577093 isoform X2 n=1 Tax=Pomacea canaliculata TaxID=400727 RepID=UPI000D73BB6F|nr:uncharacterized protein LOC112577093 isoform X2 [Pomacea canaliculata]